VADEYDIVVIGAGPAGLSAGLYGARARRRTLLIEKNVTGGQIALTAEIENYPGIMSINGFDLGQVMQQQAEKYGMETVYATVTGIEQQDKLHLIHTNEGDYLTKSLIITSGADFNHLNVPGEDRLTGFGVSYCATCDAAFFKDMDVAVVGGGDSALDEGLFVTRYASKVSVIHRRDELRAGAILATSCGPAPSCRSAPSTIPRWSSSGIPSWSPWTASQRSSHCT
jgi:thioredoxin reductase (NADPH)